MTAENFQARIQCGNNELLYRFNVYLFLVDSDLVSGSQINVIGKLLKESNKFGTYVPCWKSSSNNRAGFYASCQGKKDTISIFESTRLYQSTTFYGGFTDLLWEGRVLLFIILCVKTGTAQTY